MTKLLVAVAMTLALIGCGTKVGTGAVNVQFTNNTASAILHEIEELGVLGFTDVDMMANSYLGVTPTTFAIKLVVFYIVEAIDPVTQNNQGAGAKIWASKKCDSDLTYCGINPAYAGPYVVDYFDLARPSAVVNEELNNYERTTKDDQVGAGTYNYIRMDFTGKVYDGDTTSNMKFGTTEVHEVRAQTYGMKIALPEPLVINAGETFTVDLAYDLQKRYYSSSTYHPRPAEVSSSDSWTCKGTGSGVPCIVEPVFTATITKN